MLEILDHLVSFNKNGLWIKEPIDKGDRIISANNIKGTELKDAIIFEFNNDYKLEKKIFSKNIDISTKTWILKDVIIFKSTKGIFEKTI